MARNHPRSCSSTVCDADRNHDQQFHEGKTVYGPAKGRLSQRSSIPSTPYTETLADDELMRLRKLGPDRRQITPL